MALKGKKPETKQKRLKMFVFGKAGVGKTTAAIQFPNAYIFDGEKGTENYPNIIVKNESVVHNTFDFDTIVEELRELMVTKHPYKTVVIDPITHVFASLKDKWTKRYTKWAKDDRAKEMQDFGPAYWGRVKGEWKGLYRLLTQIDMNVIVTAHLKPEYAEGGTMVKVGETYDSDKGDEYAFDYLFQINKKGVKKDSPRFAINKKERVELGQPGFPDEFEWSYENFCKYYGKEIIEKEATPIDLATSEQVAKLTGLIGVVKIDDETITKWLNKAEVAKFEEMTKEQIEGCIKFVEGKLKTLEGGK